mgnify:CR=1 FL=1
MQRPGFPDRSRKHQLQRWIEQCRDSMKKCIKISENNSGEDSRDFWMSKTPEERLEALEVIREHYYLMKGYRETPRIKRIIKIN